MKKSSGRNRQFFLKAQKIFIGGVNSPARSFRSVGGAPLFIKKGKGPYLYDENGKRYLDFCLSWGASILGHAPPAVVSAICAQAARGTSFGTASALETELAVLIREGIPSMERIRFTNSGTESVMTVLRLARAYTQRDRIIKFDGCYHGHADAVLSGSAGVSGSLASKTVTVAYNRLGCVENAFRKNQRKIAALIVEPVAGNMGVILPQEGFLRGLRDLCDRHGTLLIFDEVITGFRFCYGGAQDYFRVKPDLTTLGKIIGGGLPIGAVGGRKEIMRLLAPEGPVYQAGTFSGNPLSMTAGISALKALKKPGVYERLFRQCKKFYGTICETVARNKVSLQLNAVGPMFSIFFASKPATDAATAMTQDVKCFRRFYHALLEEGIYFSPSPFEANFISAVHSAADLEKTLRVFGKALERSP